MKLFRQEKFEEAMRRVDPIINFGAYTRNKWVAEKARSLKGGARVLDVGAGQCQYQDLFRHCIYKTQDRSQYEGTPAGPLAEVWKYGHIDYVCDIMAIPVEDACFDAVLCTEVLEHVAEPIKAIRECARVLRAGGRLFLTAPLGSGLHQEPYHYYGGFTRYFYEKVLPECGCDVVELRAIGGLLKHVAQECHRVGSLLPQNSSKLRCLLLKYLLSLWMPRELSGLEDRGLVFEAFTVGYLVEARKRA